MENRGITFWKTLQGQWNSAVILEHRNDIMIKDIPSFVVEDVAVAVVPELNKEGARQWNCYLINMRDDTLDGVLVTSTGYGQLDHQDMKTSTLRHFLDVVEPHSYAKIETLIEDVFPLNNEYWVSYYLNKDIYDKRFIFLPGTIAEQNFVQVPIINKRCVMIR